MVLGSDNSVLRSFQGGRFFRHVLLGPEGALERVYSADSPPQGLQAPPTGTLAKLDSVLAHARALLLHRRHIACGGPGDAPSRPQAPAGGPPGELEEAAVLSNEVREDCEVEDVGRFVAFSDGRVWAKFVDRTMARLDRWHRRCRLVLPDGSAVEVRPAAPVGVEKYMAFVADFAVWAFRTPGERAAALEAQAAVEACANRAGQMARLLQWEISHELPERRARLAGPVKPPPPPWGGGRRRAAARRGRRRRELPRRHPRPAGTQREPARAALRGSPGVGGLGERPPPAGGRRRPRVLFPSS